jgi:peroxiredoxin
MFYPADFTFVCPTELEDLAAYYPEFKDMGVEVFGVSTDTHFAHKAWHDTSEAIKKVNYALIGDPTGTLTRNFEVMIEEEGLALRGTFVINPEGQIKLCEIHDNGIGRDAGELMRKVKAAQYVASAPGPGLPRQVAGRCGHADAFAGSGRQDLRPLQAPGGGRPAHRTSRSPPQCLRALSAAPRVTGAADKVGSTTPISLFDKDFAMLDANLKTQLKTYLERITQPVELVASLDDRPASAEMRELLDDIVACPTRSPAPGRACARRPSFAVRRVGTEMGVSFAAIPMGHEFTSLVLALLQAGGHPPKVEAEVIEQIQALDADLVFETYMS